MQNAKYWIDKLQLQKHPEGGWFKEVYRSNDSFPLESGQRSASTSIYYLLEGEDFSSFHRIQSDEIWHYYAGTSAVEVFWIEGGFLRAEKAGSNPEKNESFQLVVPKNCWFAARLVNPKGYALVGCTVSPGFDFNDFELADKKLLEEYPEMVRRIDELIR